MLSCRQFKPSMWDEGCPDSTHPALPELRGGRLRHVSQSRPTDSLKTKTFPTLGQKQADVYRFKARATQRDFV